MLSERQKRLVNLFQSQIQLVQKLKEKKSENNEAVPKVAMASGEKKSVSLGKFGVYDFEDSEMTYLSESQYSCMRSPVFTNKRPHTKVVKEACYVAGSSQVPLQAKNMTTGAGDSSILKPGATDIQTMSASYHVNPTGAGDSSIGRPGATSLQTMSVSSHVKLTGAGDRPIGRPGAASLQTMSASSHINTTGAGDSSIRRPGAASLQTMSASSHVNPTCAGDMSIGRSGAVSLQTMPASSSHVKPLFAIPYKTKRQNVTENTRKHQQVFGSSKATSFPEETAKTLKETCKAAKSSFEVEPTQDTQVDIMNISTDIDTNTMEEIKNIDEVLDNVLAMSEDHHISLQPLSTESYMAKELLGLLHFHTDPPEVNINPVLVCQISEPGLTPGVQSGEVHDSLPTSMLHSAMSSTAVAQMTHTFVRPAPVSMPAPASTFQSGASTPIKGPASVRIPASTFQPGASTPINWPAPVIIPASTFQSRASTPIKGRAPVNNVPNTFQPSQGAITPIKGAAASVSTPSSSFQPRANTPINGPAPVSNVPSVMSDVITGGLPMSHDEDNVHISLSKSGGVESSRQTLPKGGEMTLTRHHLKPQPGTVQPETAALVNSQTINMGQSVSQKTQPPPHNAKQPNRGTQVVAERERDCLRPQMSQSGQGMWSPPSRCQRSVMGGPSSIMSSPVGSLADSQCLNLQSSVSIAHVFRTSGKIPQVMN